MSSPDPRHRPQGARSSGRRVGRRRRRGSSPAASVSGAGVRDDVPGAGRRLRRPLAARPPTGAIADRGDRRRPSRGHRARARHRAAAAPPAVDEADDLILFVEDDVVQSLAPPQPRALGADRRRNPATSSGRSTTPTSSRPRPPIQRDRGRSPLASTAVRGWSCRSRRPGRWSTHWDDGDGPLDLRISRLAARWSPHLVPPPVAGAAPGGRQHAGAAHRTRPSTSRSTGGLGSVPGMETAAIEQFQTHGQDIPWLLEHWAEHKPDHAALVWAPREGDGRRWTYAELLADVRRLAAGLAARGHRQGRQGAHPLGELPRDGAVVAGVRHARRGRGDHQHEVGRRRGHLLRRAHRRGRRDHPAAVRGDGRRRRTGAEVDRGHRRQQRRGSRAPTTPPTASTRSTRSSATPPT